MVRVRVKRWSIIDIERAKKPEIAEVSILIITVIANSSHHSDSGSAIPAGYDPSKVAVW